MRTTGQNCLWSSWLITWSRPCPLIHAWHLQFKGTTIFSSFSQVPVSAQTFSGWQNGHRPIWLARWVALDCCLSCGMPRQGEVVTKLLSWMLISVIEGVSWVTCVTCHFIFWAANLLSKQKSHPRSNVFRNSPNSSGTKLYDIYNRQKSGWCQRWLYSTLIHPP